MQPPVVLARRGGTFRRVFFGQILIIMLDLPKPMIKLFGIGNLQTIHGREHTAARKMLTPFFRPSNLQTYIARLSHMATEMVAKWISRDQKVCYPSGFGVGAGL